MASKNVGAITALTILLTCSMLTPASGQRVMDLVRVEGERIHFMIAHGLVGGLAGKGDSAKSPLAKELLAGALEHTGLSSDDGQLDSLVGKNVAVVMVTAEISSRMKAGATIEARVASVQDAASLEGGELFLTNLHGIGEGVDRFLARAQGADQRLGLALAGRLGDGHVGHESVRLVPVHMRTHTQICPR